MNWNTHGKESGMKKIHQFVSISRWYLYFFLFGFSSSCTSDPPHTDQQIRSIRPDKEEQDFTQGWKRKKKNILYKILTNSIWWRDLTGSSSAEWINADLSNPQLPGGWNWSCSNNLWVIIHMWEMNNSVKRMHKIGHWLLSWVIILLQWQISNFFVMSLGNIWNESLYLLLELQQRCAVSQTSTLNFILKSCWPESPRKWPVRKISDSAAERWFGISTSSGRAKCLGWCLSVMLKNENRHFPQLHLNVAAAATSVNGLTVSLRKQLHWWFWDALSFSFYSHLWFIVCDLAIHQKQTKKTFSHGMVVPGLFFLLKK